MAAERYTGDINARNFYPATEAMRLLDLKHKAFKAFLLKHNIRVAYIGSKKRLVHKGDLDNALKNLTV